MGKDITIFDTDPVSRKALEKLLENEGLNDFCEIKAAHALEDQKGKKVYFWLGEGGNQKEGNNFSKPVRVGNLLTKVQAYALKSRQDTVILAIGPYGLDPVNYELTGKGVKTRLTEKEGQILVLLAKNRGMIVTRERLLKAIWGYADGIETHTLETHIYRLRQKIERDPGNPELLITEETGYRLKN